MSILDRFLVLGGTLPPFLNLSMGPVWLGSIHEESPFPPATVTEYITLGTCLECIVIFKVAKLFESLLPSKRECVNWKKNSYKTVLTKLSPLPIIRDYENLFYATLAEVYVSWLCFGVICWTYWFCFVFLECSESIHL